MQRSAPHFAARLFPGVMLVALTATVGCAAEVNSTERPCQSDELNDLGADAVAPNEIPLTLETRDGVGSQGWSLAEGALVESAVADLVISSWDCGARGRWVTLEGNGVDICRVVRGDAPELVCGVFGLEIGGSDPEVELGETFYARTEDGESYPLTLIDRTDTPFDWYEAEDLSFHVLLELGD